MKNKSFRAGVTRPLLVRVLGELVALLCRDDWQRWSTEKGDRYYYIVGAEAWSSEFSEGAEFTQVEVPAKQLIAPGPVAEFHHLGALLAKQPGYLERTRRKLEDLGVARDFLDRIVAGETLTDGSPLQPANSSIEGLEAILHFFQAVRLFRAQGSLDVFQEGDEEDIDEARQKLFLKEIREKYQGLIEKGALLQPFSFHDERLEEASRCYLYRFYKAAIVLSASAVEAHLKKVTGQERFECYEELIKGGLWLGLLDKPYAEMAENIFKKRNKVVHAVWEPNHDDAQEVLHLARKLVDTLLSAQS